MSETPIDSSKRTWLIASGCAGAVGGVATAVPFVSSFQPSEKAKAAGAAVEVDISALKPGEKVTVEWRGKPVFVRHRTAAEIEMARTVNTAELRDPAGDDTRVKKPEWLILVGVCTHLGCVPLGQKSGDARGDFGGWFCPCHGSHYDTSGRIRKGPAPANLVVPEYSFLSDSVIRIG